MILSPWYTYDERKHGYIYYLRVDNICYHGDDSIRSQELVTWNYPSFTFSFNKKILYYFITFSFIERVRVNTIHTILC